ncbi:DNA-binding transcriptional regulator, MarR family [Klenkia soli]|uniref:DNA-binding transcriptional regulator, MarR family n=1 Tax=Klenkia soli TaxID=1052260 RepID=A0A1H0UQM5_9ACTN|nr:MarR family transcriptional regulator [Klenkia soli]SDP68383.1 DNA-binding transcriptional regulator, MarR family [Klenkia soli]
MQIAQSTADRLTSGLSQLIRTGRHLSQSAAHELYGDLPGFGWALLAPLERDGEQRCSALAAGLGVDGSVASRQIAALEKDGYVVRRPDPLDGRASLIGLSETGAAALARTRAVRSGWAAAALAGWTDEEADTLCGLLERLTADLSLGRPPRTPAPA